MKIKNPITNTYNTIFSKEGKLTLKKYIEQFQLIGGTGAGEDAEAGVIYPYTMPDTGESHNEPIAPTRLNEHELFKGRTAETEMKLYALFGNINNVLEQNQIPHRLGVVRVSPHVYNNIQGSLWEFIDGRAVNANDEDYINSEENVALKNNLYLLEAVARLIGLTDLHNSNIIFKDNIPYCIDGEVFHVTLDNPNTGLQGFYPPIADNEHVVSMINRLRDIPEIMLLINNFRENLNNYRVLLGSTPDFIRYAGFYKNYKKYCVDQEAGKNVLREEILQNIERQRAEDSTDYEYIELTESELSGEHIRLCENSEETLLAETHRISELISDHLNENDLENTQEIIDNIIECINTLITQVVIKQNKVFVPVFLYIDNNLYINYTNGLCGEPGTTMHMISTRRKDVGGGATRVLKKNKHKSNKRKSNKRKSNKRKSNKRKSNKRKSNKRKSNKRK